MMKTAVGLEEQRGANGRLIERVVVEEAGTGPLEEADEFRGQVKLRHTAIGQGDIDLDKVVEAGERAAAETGPGLFGAGDGDPYVALLLGEGAPTGGDSGEDEAHRDLSGGARIEGDKGGVGDLPVTGALPNPASAFSRLPIGHFHK